MRIVHISPSCVYNEGWGYQENLLPKYQVQMGHEVILIVSTEEYKNGEISHVEPNDYYSEDGYRVIRIPKKSFGTYKITRLFSVIKVYELLIEIEPSFIFVHGLINTTINQVVKYKRKINKKCIIVQDSHSDTQNCSFGNDFKGRLLAKFYSLVYRKNEKYIEKVYGVTPERKNYAVKVFGVSENKADVLIMGADDEYIALTDKNNIKELIRKKYNISNEDFLVVTGGKITRDKKVLELMDAINDIENIKLLIFGEIDAEIDAEFRKRISNKIICIGWIESKDVYNYFLAADLVIFLGTHSVLWEQACASKVPCIFKKWSGMEHLNVDGNCSFIEEIAVHNIKQEIMRYKFTDEYYEMLKNAMSEKTNVFLYSDIAKKSIECMVK